MRRLAPLLALLLAAPALARSPALPPLRIAARLDPAAADHTPALQAAIDEAIAARAAAFKASPDAAPTATVIVPDGRWALRSPVFVDGPGVEVRAENRGNAIFRPAGGPTPFGHPLVILGFPRGGGAGTKVPDAAYRPEVTGLLDGTPGKRWGIDTGPDMTAACPAGMFSHGPFSPGSALPDNWGLTRKFTLELAHVGPIQPGAYLCGLGSIGYGPAAPFALAGGGTADTLDLLISTVDKRFGAVTTRHFYASLPPNLGPGLRRVVAQVDYDAGTVDLLLGSGSSPWVPAGNVPLKVSGNLPAGSIPRENATDTFAIGGPNMGLSPPARAVVAGLSLSASIRYDRATGARADKGATTDLYRYFPPPVQWPASAYDPAAIGHLPLAEDPASAPRVLTVQGGPAAGNRACVALLCHAGMFGRPAGDLKITGLDVAAEQCYGAALMVGDCLDLQVRDCTAKGGIYGIANLPTGANYPVLIRDCQLAGNDSGYFGISSVVRLDGIGFTSNGRVAIRTLGCALTAEHCFVARAGSPQYAFASIHSAIYGGSYSFHDVSCDNEGDTYELAWIYAERGAYSQTQLWLDKPPYYPGTVGSVPLVRWRDMAPTGGAYTPAMARIVGLGGDSTGPVLEVDGPGLKGSVEGSGTRAGDDSVANLKVYPGPTAIGPARPSGPVLPATPPVQPSSRNR